MNRDKIVRRCRNVQEQQFYNAHLGALEMLSVKRFFHLAGDRQKQIIIAVLLVMLLHAFTRRNPFFVQSLLQQFFPVTHVATSNTLPLHLVWSYSSPDAIKVPPVSNNKIVVVLFENGLLRAFDKTTGQIKWEYDTGATIGVPRSSFLFDLNEERLIIPVKNSELLALDVESGKKIWERALRYPTSTTPNILLLGDTVLVSNVSIVPSANEHVATYQMENGEFVSEILVLSRTYNYTFPCSNDLLRASASKLICILLYDRLWLVDPVQNLKVLESILTPLPSKDTPRYEQGYIFTNPSPEPAPYVFDIAENKQFSLPVSCSKERTSQPVTTYDKYALIATGCNELYLLPINNLQTAPTWVFHSDENLLSSFVTIEGKTGYVLNEKGEVLGINLADGSLIGKFATEPANIDEEQFASSLVVDPPYLFVFLGGNTFFVFEVID